MYKTQYVPGTKEIIDSSGAHFIRCFYENFPRRFFYKIGFYEKPKPFFEENLAQVPFRKEIVSHEKTHLFKDIFMNKKGIDLSQTKKYKETVEKDVKEQLLLKDSDLTAKEKADLSFITKGLDNKDAKSYWLEEIFANC